MKGFGNPSFVPMSLRVTRNLDRFSLPNSFARYLTSASRLQHLQRPSFIMALLVHIARYFISHFLLNKCGFSSPASIHSLLSAVQR